MAKKFCVIKGFELSILHQLAVFNDQIYTN